MTLNGISGKAYFYEKLRIKSEKDPDAETKSGQSFSGCLKGMEEEAEEMQKEQEAEQKKGTSVTVEYQSQKAASELRIRQDGGVEMRAVLECEARHIRYDQSDYVKVFAEEGYALKVQILADRHTVYVEQKNEDGTTQAYEVNPLLVPEDTKDPIEQTAAEAWSMAKELFAGGIFTEYEGKTEEAGQKGDDLDAPEDFEQMLVRFQAYVRKRLKDGPPKIQTGGSAFSEEEWERFLRKIDKNIDAYKEELRARIQKRKGETPTAKADSAAGEEESVLESAGVEESHKPQGPSISENEVLKAEKTQASSSFLARLSGTKRAPYAYLADSSGMIVYKGVTFTCDNAKQRICLGDVSDPNKALRIPLTKGGSLWVNRDNISDLVGVIDMFSPEDIARILRAIAQDSKIQQIKLEIEQKKGPDTIAGASE